MVTHGVFSTIKKDHQWLKNVLDALGKIGFGDVWLNPQAWDKTTLKRVISNRLRDINIQVCSQYTTNLSNQEKCKVINYCYGELYVQREYLNNIKSPDMRSILTKLRIDMNCTVDSHYRSFRRKNVDSGVCPCGWEKQIVEHVLFECVNIKLAKARRKFEEGYCIYVITYMYNPLPLETKESHFTHMHFPQKCLCYC